MRLNIRLACNGDKDKWDDFVRSSPYASPYHLFAWRISVEEAYGHKSYYLMAEEKNNITGIMPLIYLKPPLIAGQLVALPFCDAGDALAGNEDTKEKLVREAISLARTLKAKYMEVREQNKAASYTYLQLPIKERAHKVRMLLELPESSRILWSNFKSKLRSQIRKAGKNDLTFKWGGIEKLDDFYNVFSRNMRDLGSPVHSKKWFCSVLRHYGNNVHMGLVYYRKLLVGVGIILNTNKIVSVPWASTLNNFNELSPNMLLYWNFLKYASDNGYARFDFGRSTPNGGTYKFKAQWGAEPAPLYWNYILLDGEELKTDTPDISKRELLARLWRLLPLTVANYIGPIIRKHISL